MKRLLLSLVVVGVAVAASYALVGALNPAVPAQTWVTAGDMTDVRTGAAGTLLLDGRVLITGGVTGSGVTASAERYSPAAWGFVATPSMERARASHSATLLVDGRVLVTGGTGADGQISATAELFDPATNAWTPAGALNVPRRGHTATRLADGRVLIAGGDMGAQPTAAL
jgi:Galactose oxidase, central domain